MTEDVRDLRSQAIAILLGAAETSGEMNTLARVARRAGFLWTCPSCLQDNYANRDACCGKPRPAEDVRDA